MSSCSSMYAHISSSDLKDDCGLLSSGVLIGALLPAVKAQLPNRFLHDPNHLSSEYSVSVKLFGFGCLTVDSCRYPDSVGPKFIWSEVHGYIAVGKSPFQFCFNLPVLTVAIADSHNVHGKSPLCEATPPEL